MEKEYDENGLAKYMWGRKLMDSETKVNLIMILFIGILIIVLSIFSGIESTAKYNNGICAVCGGHYEYQQAVGHRYTTRYIYRCDKCGRIIEVDSVYQEKCGNDL